VPYVKPPEPIAVVETPPVAKKLDVPIQIKVDPIYFSMGRAEIKRESHKTLDSLIKTLKDLSAITKLRIEGYTDTVGAPDRNLKLSRERAEAVYNYLVKGGVEAARLEWEGYGQERPLVSNETDQGRRTNRRVEFNIVEAIGSIEQVLPAK
ncbi:MAG: OmpA family protein, partial [Bdellovibrionota bacterium]